MEFDFSTFFSVSVAGIPLSLVVLGLVTYLAQLGVTGRGLLISSFAIGLFFGGAYQISELGPPGTFGAWFGVLVYGLALGLFSSGVYNTGKRIVTRALVQLVAPQVDDHPQG